MRTVVAIVKPFRVRAVLRALSGLGVQGVSYGEVRGYGRQKGHLEAYEGSEIGIEFIPKVRIELTVDDLFLDEVVRVIGDAARTGRIGDGKLFIFRTLELTGVSGDAPGAV